MRRCKIGYEVIFSYYDKKSDGVGYDVETPKTHKKIIGKPTEEISLEQIAKVIFGQLARRDIWVIDAEIHEYTKKKVSFKETKDGIVIKHKKFSFDMTCESESIDISSVEHTSFDNSGFVDAQEYEDIPLPVIKQEIPAAPLVIPSNLTNQPVGLPNLVSQHKPVIKEKPLRWEIYDPEQSILILAKKKNLPFTVGKKYPIYSETTNGVDWKLGMNYLTEDDNGNRRTVNDKFFTPVVGRLEGGFENEMISVNEATVVKGSEINMPIIKTFGR